MECEGNKHRTTSGLVGGNLATTAWTTCAGKQKRTDEEQAEFEVAAKYTHQLAREYHESMDSIDEAKIFEPMLAKTYTTFPGGEEICIQPKLDGVRCIATRKGLFSRQGQPLVAAPHIVEALALRFAEDPDLIFDGELYNHELKDDFNKLISLIRRSKPSDEDLNRARELVQYHIYDLPSAPGPFTARWEALCEHIVGVNSPHIPMTHTMGVTSEGHGDLLHGAFLEDGYEGSIYRLDSHYEAGKRSVNLLKRKEFQDEEFAVVAIEEGQGNWAGYAKRVTCRLPDGREFGAGIKGDQSRAKLLLNETHKVVTVRFFQYTPDGVPRFPVATKFWGEARTL